MIFLTRTMVSFFLFFLGFLPLGLAQGGDQVPQDGAKIQSQQKTEAEKTKEKVFSDLDKLSRMTTLAQVVNFFGKGFKEDPREGAKILFKQLEAPSAYARVTIFAEGKDSTKFNKIKLDLQSFVQIDEASVQKRYGSEYNDFRMPMTEPEGFVLHAKLYDFMFHASGRLFSVTIK